MKEALKKAVILARGLGTRMRAVTGDAVLDAAQLDVAAKGLKALMPLGDGRVLLDVIFARLRAAGAERICLVVGPEQREFRDFCTARDYDVEFAIQAEPRGRADAVLAACDFAVGDRFLVVNSDNLYPSECLANLFSLDGAGLIGFELAGLVEKGNIPAERIQKFATLETDSSDF